MLYFDAPARPTIAVTTVAEARDAGPSSLFVAGMLLRIQGVNFYDFDTASMAADNGTTILKPNDIGGGSPGRWISAASGAQGAQGGSGVQGAQGANGAQGAQGGSGVQGAQGSSGVQGFQGAQGIQGAQGSATGSAGGDLAGTYPNPTVVALEETSSPARLAIGAIADGQLVKRVGTTLVGSATCVTNLVSAPGLYACAENDQTVASGFASHAEGTQTRAGEALQAFTIPANGVTVTIVGDVTAFFTNGEAVRVTPSTPSALPTVARTVASVPVFAAGNTTFNLNAVVDTTTTAGTISGADGIAAHAEGFQCVASGDYSHAEGYQTIASGIRSHAEGYATTASGERSHAEGSLTTASGVRSHSEGSSTLASGDRSHTEGIATIASGLQSHAEGNSSTSSGNTSHAEGLSCVSSGLESHAEGHQCTASGNYSHSQGFACTASGVAACAVGTDANALRDGDFAISNGKFSELGDNQTRFSQVKGSTPGSVSNETVALKPGGLSGNLLEASKAYTVQITGCATVIGLGTAVRQTWNFVLVFGASRRSGGTIDVTAVTTLASIVTGAGFVGATLVPTDGGSGNLLLTFSITGGLTVASYVTAMVKYIEVLGT